MRTALLLVLLWAAGSAAPVPVDLAAVRPGEISVLKSGDAVVVRWKDEQGAPWEAEFAADSEQPAIRAIRAGDQAVLQGVRPVYRANTGVRRGGWDAFFDYPPSHPEGTRRYQGQLALKGIAARSEGDRVVVELDGFSMGPFQGRIAYTFYPASRLIRQEALATPDVDNLAYLYEAAIEYDAPWDRRPGNNMETGVGWYDTRSAFQMVYNAGLGPERIPVHVRHRMIGAQTAGGSVAVFPEPHRYFPPRDFTSNTANLWHRAWRGVVGLGIRQPDDTNWRFYPWMNAPPGRTQRMALFLQLSRGSVRAGLEEVLRYTNGDRFPALPGYKTMAVHWHVAYTVQAMEFGANWEPPFKPVLREMGVDAAMIMDFHGDGHPRDLTDLRLKELKAFYDFSRAQSGPDFLLIPAEEANVHLGGHWSVVFPHQVLWWMDRPAGGSFTATHPVYGKVYSTANEQELLALIRQEGGYMYQTHPRTKGSTGYPDKILATEHFRDNRYWGAGWKAMPADLSQPALGMRSLRLLDDLAAAGYRKRLLGEVDVFQVDSTHELYAHMNINYVRADTLPSFDRYGELLNAMDRGEFFVSTGEVLLPEVRWERQSGRIRLAAQATWRFPLAFAEIVWGDGEKVHRTQLDLTSTRAFGSKEFQWELAAPGWRWARLAVWDVAGNGAFTNPEWREQ